MGIAFIVANSKLPGLNYEAPPAIRDLEFSMDTVFSEEQRNRLQLMMAQYRTSGPSYGIVDESNPNSATPGSGRPLCVQPNTGNPLTVDVLPGFATTKSGNIIIVTEQLSGLKLADESVSTSTSSGGTNVVLLEYNVVDDAETNVVTDYAVVEAVRRVVAPVYDADATKPQLLKIVKLTDYLDSTKFSSQRLNDVVVLALVRTVASSVSGTSTTSNVLSIDMTNAVNTYVRPWFSPVDQQHRAAIGTGTVTSTNVHGLSLNEMSQGAFTLIQQLAQHGLVLSRDADVPGCPGKLCSELIDSVRVFTDSTGTVTGTVNRKYVTLNSYPQRLLGARENKLDGSTIVEDKSVTARPVAVEMIPNSNVMAFHRRGVTDESIDSTKGFTVYYTDVDCLRPPALPRDMMLVSNDIIQMQDINTDTDLIVTGGKEYASLPTKQYTVGTNGPVPKIYQLWLDNDQQLVQSPQVIQCAVLLTDPPGVGVAIQEPQFEMYGPARIRVALWNATLPAPSNLQVKVEISGKDVAGASISEIVIFHGTAATASPRQIAWTQPGTPAVAGMDYPAVFQVTEKVFASIDSWKIQDAPVAAGSNALVQLWAEIEPTTTSTLDDALPVCKFWWNGQAVAQIRDNRPIASRLIEKRGVTDEQMSLMTSMLGISTASNLLPVMSESFKAPRWQDNILSKRLRSNDVLDSAFTDETLGAFSADGTHPGREWYYSRAIPLGSSLNTLYMVLFGDESEMFNTAFGTDALVEYQIFGTPTIGGSWTAMPQIGHTRLRQLSGLSTEFKIRFRIAGKRLSGFALVLRTL